MHEEVFLWNVIININQNVIVDNKQLLDEVFVIYGIIKVEVSVISRADGEADNLYRDLGHSAYHKNRIQ